MFLHVGNSKNIREKDIIGIFDADTATVSGITRRYLAAAEKNGTVETACTEVPKSFVLYREKAKERVCFSQLSSLTLTGRQESIYNSMENKIQDK